MEATRGKAVQAILRVLAEAGRPVSSVAIAEELQGLGVDLQPRMVRNYLVELDRRGFTQRSGHRRRVLTKSGARELELGMAVSKVGLAAARVDELAYRMSFDPATGRGSVVVNVSTFRASDFPEAHAHIRRVIDRGLGMGRLLVVRTDSQRLGGHHVPYGQVAVGTVCSITFNGALRTAGIPAHARFGGLLELRDGKPLRFVHIINYDGSTVDPVDMFLKSHMTNVQEAAATGSGLIGASFREIPASAFDDARNVMDRLKTLRLDCVLAVGRPDRPLLEVPVSPGRVGIVVAAGLNAVAAVEEAGIKTRNYPMDAVCPVEDLAPVEAWEKLSAASTELQARLARLAERGASGERDSFLFE